MVGLAGRTPFVGRQRELAVLLRCLDTASHGDAGLVIVGGEPGIGKTRLLQEAARQATDHGWTVLAGRAYESEGMPPYLPFAEVIRGYLRANPSDELRARQVQGATGLALLVPELRTLVPDLPPAATLSPEHERYQLFEQVCDFLLAIARPLPPGPLHAGGGDKTERPLPSQVEAPTLGTLLVLDDLQWADKPSLLLLLHLARRLRATSVPLLVAGMYRTVDLPHTHPLANVLADLSRERLAERIMLGALSREETTGLVGALAGIEPASAARVAREIYHETTGNPFLIEELVRDLRAEGQDLAGPGAAIAGRGIPEGIRQVIGKRLARLSAAAMRLLQAAAVLGGGFTFTTLGTVSGMEDAALVDALEEALTAGLLREAEQRYQFTHDLVRQAIYNELSAPRRVRLHQAAAEALEQAYAANPRPHLAELAHHCCVASQEGFAARGIDYARRAGDHALSLLAYEEGGRLYRMALRVLDAQELPDAQLRCDLLLALGEAQRRAGELREAMQTFMQAAAVARVLAAPDRLAQAALGYEDAMLPTGIPRAGADDPSVMLQEEALRALGTDGGPLRARLLAGLGRAVHFAGGRDRAEALSTEAVATARRLGDTATLAYALNARRMTVWGPDRLDERLALTDELVRLAEMAGDRELALEGRHWRLRALVEQGDIAAVDAEIAAFTRAAEALRQPHYLAEAAGWHALRALLDGRCAEAEGAARRARALGPYAPNDNPAMFYTGRMLAVYREQEDRDGLLALAPEVRRFAQDSGIPAWQVQIALLHVRLDEEAEARHAFELLAADDFAVLMPDWLWLPMIGYLAEVCAYLHDARRAPVLYALLLPYADRILAESGVLGPAGQYLGLLAATSAQAAAHDPATAAHWARAERHFEDALAVCARIGARPALARTCRVFAEMLLARGRRGDGARARGLLERARTIYREIGLERPAARVEELLATGAPDGRRPWPAGHAYPAGLTEREVEVLRLIADGRSNQQIADALVLSVRTVERHITNLYAKIDARGKADATGFALRHGLTLPSTA